MAIAQWDPAEDTDRLAEGMALMAGPAADLVAGARPAWQRQAQARAPRKKAG